MRKQGKGVLARAAIPVRDIGANGRVVREEAHEVGAYHVLAVRHGRERHKERDRSAKIVWGIGEAEGAVRVLSDVPGETTRNVERHLADAAAHSPIPQLSAGSYAPRAALFTRMLVSSSCVSPASATSTSTLRLAPRALRSEMTLSMLMLRSSPFSAAYTVRKGTPDAAESSLRLRPRISRSEPMSVPASTLEDMIMVRPVPRLVQCAASIADSAACCNGCGFCSVLHLALAMRTLVEMCQLLASGVSLVVRREVTGGVEAQRSRIAPMLVCLDLGGTTRLLGPSLDVRRGSLIQAPISKVM